MFNIKQLAAVAALVASGAAVAAPVTVNLGSGSIASATTLTTLVKVGATPTATFTAVIRGTTAIGDVFSLSLFNSANQLVAGVNTLDAVSVGFKKETFTNTYTNLAAGNYTLKLVSGVNGGTYGLSGSYNLPTSPVPEPLTMVLSLFGAAAVLVTRRKPQ